MEKALEKFIAYWKQREDVKGILLTGSYAVGIENADSDVDIRLLLTDDATTSFKGLDTIDGYVFSFIGRNKSVTLQKFNRQFFSHVKMEARIYTVGKVLYDPVSDIASLIEVAKTYVESPLIAKEISESDLELYMHSLHKKYSYVLNSTNEDPFYAYNYILYLKNALNYYADVLNAEIMFENDSKLSRFLTDERYLSAYGYSKFPDQYFLDLWLSALKEKSHLKIKEINTYLRKNLHNFNDSNTIISWDN
jgi:predicted nucleotidyltransferase